MTNEKLVQNAVNAMKARDLEAALRYAKALTEADSGNPINHVLLGNILLGKNDAIALFDSFGQAVDDIFEPLELHDPGVAEGVEVFLEHKILYGPGKAANAGGVAVSGLEMSQNSMRLSWTREEVDQRLHDIMVSIHNACTTTADEYGDPGNYVLGANISGFIKIADSMLDQGVV